MAQVALTAFENELGVQAPVGFWDPAGWTMQKQNRKVLRLQSVTQSARSAAQQLFYQQHTIKQQSQNISADPKNAPKRTQQTKTGLTPERKQQKGNDDGI